MADYPKKYWWLVLIAVPMIAALISIIPSLIKKQDTSSGPIYISNTKFSGDMHFTNIDMIFEEYERIMGEPLTDQQLKNEIKRGINLVKGGFYEDAIPVFKQIADQAKLPALYNNLGVLYANEGDFKSAREMYKAAIVSSPEDQAVQLNLGLLYEQEGRTEDAKLHFNKAPELKVAKQALKKIQERRKAGTVEVEPNDKILEPNVVALDTWIQGTIASQSDWDYFRFTIPETFRDIIKVEIENQSTTLRPVLSVYDANKHKIWGNDGYYWTPGQNLDHSFITKPDLVYHLAIGGYKSNGAYQLKITPLRVFDGYEPNDDIRQAKTISIGKSINAKIMDPSDWDYYSFKTATQDVTITISIENQSTTLRPVLSVYDSDKHKIWGNDGYYWTPGQNLNHSFVTKPDLVYYLAIGGYKSNGAYQVTISEKSDDVDAE